MRRLLFQASQRKEIHETPISRNKLGMVVNTYHPSYADNLSRRIAVYNINPKFCILQEKILLTVVLGKCFLTKTTPAKKKD